LWPLEQQRRQQQQEKKKKEVEIEKKEQQHHQQKKETKTNNHNNKTIKIIKISTTTTSTEIAKRNTRSSSTTNINNTNPLSNFQRYTKGLSKNKSLRILDDVKVHNVWGNIFRRKHQMHPYFSESAFGSQVDSKIEYRNLWEDPEMMKKYNLSATKDSDDNQYTTTTTTT